NMGRNGTGKSTIVSALSYVLFGTSINNDIKKNNLINNINDKEMFVSISFKKDGHKYIIERGRKPTFLRFFIDNKKIEGEVESEDEAQGENRHTQHEIERVLGFSHNIFKHII